MCVADLGYNGQTKTGVIFFCAEKWSAKLCGQRCISINQRIGLHFTWINFRKTALSGDRYCHRMTTGIDMGMNLYTALGIVCFGGIGKQFQKCGQQSFGIGTDKDIACIRIKLKGICAVWELFIKDIR